MNAARSTPTVWQRTIEQQLREQGKKLNDIERDQAVVAAITKQQGEYLDEKFDNTDSRFNGLDNKISNVKRDLSDELAKTKKDLTEDIAAVRSIIVKIGWMIIAAVIVAVLRLVIGVEVG